MQAESPQPQPLAAGVLVCAGFFALAGALELAVSVWELPKPLRFWPVWEALGRAIFSFLLALGLWRRLALCRSIAMVYCLAAIVTYAVVLGLALTQAPLAYPPSVVIGSLVEVPSCALLLPYLRSKEASLLFPRPLFGPF
jgi:hypothetical protein